MDATTINATELRIQTRDILERARFKGERFMVKTFGRPVAVIIGIEEYTALTRKNQKPMYSSRLKRKKSR